MKKLLIILSIIPILVFSQVYVHDVDFNQSNYGYHFNGTDNYINTLANLAGATSLNINIKYITDADVTTAQRIMYQDEFIGGNTSYRITIIVLTDNVLYIIRSGVANQTVTVPVVASTYYNDVVIYNNSQFCVISNEIQYNAVGYVGTPIESSNTTLFIGATNAGTQKYKGTILEYSYTINAGSEVKVPISIGYSNKIYDVNSGDTYTILGTNTQSQWKTNSNYSYGALYGMTKVKYLNTLAYIPYLQSGLPLYPDIDPIINAGEQIINYPTSYWTPKIVVK